MSKLNSDIYINSETSKIVLNSIIEGKKINFKKLKIELLKKDVNNLKKQYLDIKNNNHYDNKDFGYRSIGYQKMYADVSLSFYCSEEMRELEFLQNWMKLIIQPGDNRVGYYNDYIGNIDIIKLDRQQKPVMTTHLIDAYPKGISAMELSYGSNNEVMSVSATFTYRYYTQVFGEKQETVGRGLNQITPVQRKNITAGIIDRTLTQEQRKDIFDGDTVGSNDEFESSE